MRERPGSVRARAAVRHRRSGVGRGDGSGQRGATRGRIRVSRQRYECQLARREHHVCCRGRAGFDDPVERGHRGRRRTRCVVRGRVHRQSGRRVRAGDGVLPLHSVRSRARSGTSDGRGHDVRAPPCGLAGCVIGVRLERGSVGWRRRGTGGKRVAERPGFRLPAIRRASCMGVRRDRAARTARSAVRASRSRSFRAPPRWGGGFVRGRNGDGLGARCRSRCRACASPGDPGGRSRAFETRGAGANAHSVSPLPSSPSESATRR